LVTAATFIRRARELACWTEAQGGGGATHVERPSIATSDGTSVLLSWREISSESAAWSSCGDVTPPTSVMRLS
jgi:hypothetical protein